MHALTRSAPKSRWGTQIHNLHFKAYKYILLMSLSKSLGFVMYKERERVENQLTSYERQILVLP